MWLVPHPAVAGCLRTASATGHENDRIMVADFRHVVIIDTFLSERTVVQRSGQRVRAANSL
jgi:hypothetical protein